MTAIPFPVSSAPGVRPQEGAGRLKNAHTEKTEQGARSPLLWRRSAGLSTKATLADVNCRGMLAVNDTLIDVRSGQVYGVSYSAGTYTPNLLGALSGTAPVTIARNTKSPTPDIVAVTEENGAAILSLSGAPSAYPDVDLPFVNSVCVLNSKFLFTTRAGIVWASGINTTTIDGSAFAEAESRPDGLRRGIAFGDEFFAWGDTSCDVFGENSDPTSPFPLEFKQTIPKGICGTHAIAGFEEGWSNAVCWVGDDSVVYRLNGYAGVPISNSDVSRTIEATPDKTLIRAHVYMAGGNAFLVITDPGNWTWECNLKNGTWNERESYSIDGWRVGTSARAFERWVAGSRIGGQIYELAEGVYRDGDDPLVWEIESGVLANFPEQFSPCRLDIDITAGVGTSIGVDLGEGNNEIDPTINIYWSTDGGATWSDPVQRKVGMQGKYNRRVSVNRLGKIGPKGLKIKIRGSDPVHYALMGATVTARG